MHGLYVITESWQGRTHADVARAAVVGGASVIQLRDKQMPVRELLAVAQELRQICTAAGAMFVVNDRLDLALAVRADGVHLGEGDLPIPAARRAAEACGRRIVIGASASTVEEAQRAVAAGADYLGVGSVSSTTTKPDAGAPIGLARLAEICRAVSASVIAVGGINVHNVSDIIRAGAAGAAVISAVSRAPDMQAAARALARAIADASQVKQ